MFKRAVVTFLVLLSLTLSGCVTKTGGLAPFVDSKDGYSFLYPNGWLQKMVKNGPDIVFHDLVEPSENVSVVIGKLKSVKSLSDLGTANDVGLRIQEKVIGSGSSANNASLISAEQYENNGKNYYLLEYLIKGAQVRHDLVTVTESRGNFYTLSISTLESRWLRLKDLFYRVANSFSVS
jgi:photosystem II oxygen-evolving enhancer protein 2